MLNFKSQSFKKISTISQKETFVISRCSKRRTILEYVLYNKLFVQPCARFEVPFFYLKLRVILFFFLKVDLRKINPGFPYSF